MDISNSMAGKVCLVTGASSGVGLMTALGLAKNGAHTFIACRSEAKAIRAISFIHQKSGNSNIEYLPLDLASPKSVYSCVDQFKKHNLPLHVLVNNAGIFFGEGLTNQGFNQIFAVNYIGHFLLTYLLLEKLQNAGSARIIMVSSDTAYQVKAIDWKLIFTHIPEYQILRKFNHTLKVYSFSKLCILLLMTELVKQLQGQTVTVNAVHPGFVQSNISLLHRWSKWLGLGITGAEGAQSLLFLATAPELEGISGKFLGSNSQEMELPKLSQDNSLAHELWQRSLSLAGCKGTKNMMSKQLTTQLPYDGRDGIWGPFQLQGSSENMETIAEAIVTQILPRPPIKLLFRSLIESWVQAEGIMPTFFNLFQFFTGRYYMERHLDSSLVLSLCKDRLLLKTLQEFLGDRFLLWRSEIWVSKPSSKIVSFWHQDCYANFLKGPGKAITAYIALTEVNELNGMEYIPNAYVESGEVRVAAKELEVMRIAGNHQFTVPKELEHQAVPVKLKPGEFVLFNDRFIHRSLKNQGKSNRISMAVRFVQDTVEVLPGFSPIHAEPVLLTLE